MDPKRVDATAVEDVHVAAVEGDEVVELEALLDLEKTLGNVLYADEIGGVNVVINKVRVGHNGKSRVYWNSRPTSLGNLCEARHVRWV